MTIFKTSIADGHGGSSDRHDALNEAEAAEEYAFALAAVEGRLEEQ